MRACRSAPAVVRLMSLDRSRGRGGLHGQPPKLPLIAARSAKGSVPGEIIVATDELAPRAGPARPFVGVRAPTRPRGKADLRGAGRRDSPPESRVFPGWGEVRWAGSGTARRRPAPAAVAGAGAEDIRGPAAEDQS